MPRKSKRRVSTKKAYQGASPIPPERKRTPKEIQKSFPPQGDGFLADPCAELRSLVDLLLFDICMEIDSRYVDLPLRKQKKYRSSRSLILAKIMKLQGFVKEVHKSGDVIVEAMQDRVTEDGLIVKEVF